MDQGLQYQFLKFVRAEIADIMDGNAGLEDSLAAGDTRQSFRELQHIAIAAGNVSKLLWGGEKATIDRQELRRQLGITDGSPFEPPRHVRNALEHIDSRIEEWWEKSKNHNMVDGNFGTREKFAGFEEIELFRGYDRATGTFWFRGYSFEVRAIVLEARRIQLLFGNSAPRMRKPPPTPG
jgi:hypothetical protein